MTFDTEQLSQPLSRVFFNARATVYPDGTARVMASDRAIFRAPGWELGEVAARREKIAQTEARDFERYLDAVNPECEMSAYALMRREDAEARKRAESLSRAQRRARAAVRDLALSNPFRWFVTLTLDASRVDRYDVREVTRKLNAWLDNHVRRDGLAYVLVPELHKDGAIHFHGLFNDALEAVDSGTVDMGTGRPRKPRSARQRAAWLSSGGHVVYNLPAWTLGFTTAIELYGDRSKAVGYVCKYIAKQQRPGPDGTAQPGRIGGRWYYSGGALQRPRVELFNLGPGEFERLDGYETKLPELGGARLKILDVNKEEKP
jgi:hypothetical protein